MPLLIIKHFGINMKLKLFLPILSGKLTKLANAIG